MTINVARKGRVAGPMLWASVDPMPVFRNGEMLSAEQTEANLLAMKAELLLREAFLADVRRIGYKRAIERLEIAVAAIRAKASTAVVIVDRAAAQQAPPEGARQRRRSNSAR